MLTWGILVECFVIGLSYLFGIRVMCCQILKKSQTTASEGVERSGPWLESDCSGWWYCHCWYEMSTMFCWWLYNVWSSKQYQLFIMLHSHENKETLLNMNPLPTCAAWIKQCKAVNSIHWGVSPCIHHPPMTSPVLLRSQWCPGDTKRTKKKMYRDSPQKKK